MNHVEGRIAECVRAVRPDLATRSLAVDTPLIEGELSMDSVELLELLTMVEEAFGVTVQDEDLTVDLLRDIRSLGAFVQRRLPVVAS
jgi:acyl carrier protein